MRNVIERGSEFGIGIRARRTEDGRWVKTIVLTFPNLFAIEDAKSIDIEAIMLVTKKRDPSFPSWRLYLSRKNHTTHESGASPDAKESSAKKRQR